MEISTQTESKGKRRRRPPRTVQCYRCQRWGHLSYTCQEISRCVKCTGLHRASECSKSPEDLPVCCNCLGNHPASYRGCPHAPRRRKEDSRTRSPKTGKALSFMAAVCRLVTKGEFLSPEQISKVYKEMDKTKAPKVFIPRAVQLRIDAPIVPAPRPAPEDVSGPENRESLANSMEIDQAPPTPEENSANTEPTANQEPETMASTNQDHLNIPKNSTATPAEPPEQAPPPKKDDEEKDLRNHLKARVKELIPEDTHPGIFIFYTYDMQRMYSFINSTPEGRQRKIDKILPLLHRS